jgi:hypothetical protein
MPDQVRHDDIEAKGNFSKLLRATLDHFRFQDAGRNEYENLFKLGRSVLSLE